MSKLDKIEKEVEELHNRLLIAEPSHFSTRDLVDAFFGALFLGITFTIKGLLVEVSLILTKFNIIFIIISTLLILTAEIYFIGYSRVTKKAERKFFQFWFKRIFAFYFVSLLTATFLVYLFGLNNLPQVIANNNYTVLKMIILISMPCSIGAAITDLLKKY
ncbi:MAG: DUF2391 family protein [Candidatus Pacearchaeota archaeon]